MNELIDKIFKSYKYIQVADIGGTNLAFYKHECAEIANYFLIYTIDCREFEENEEQIKKALEQLEKDYSKSTNFDNLALKQKIIDSFNNIKEASQIDKNTSAIYLLLFDNVENLNSYRNTVYSIEESPNYFKRYVLPYTQNQLNHLNDALSQFGNRSIDDALCQIVDNEDSYFTLVEGKDLESTYGLVIRMFSKLPFLQYKFKTELAPEPIEKRVEGNLKAELIKYHNILKDNTLNIENILSLEDDLKVKNDELEKEIIKLLKGVKS
ncbi:ABC-three component system middle component 1 [Desulfitobacterium sp. Sab5]|uniref:ABC-three component system middle component 1 n=1 Tax=Desulfitobacterium nosdiversum TaxID=3375356 RepID=UPI003CF59E39